MTVPGPTVPAPPPGPGVVPPFAAPPVEGRTMRVWLGLGVAGLFTLLCCGGGAVAVVGLAVASTEAVDEQAQAVTRDYFDAVSKRQFNRAYGLLCDEAQDRETPRAFERRVAAGPAVTSFQVGPTDLGQREVVVPVTVTEAGGIRRDLRVTLAQDGRTGALEVCAVR